MPLEPATLEEFAEAVRSHPHVLAVGSRSKPRLSVVPPDTTLLSTKRLAGLVEYEPDEFTFTARAGTLIRDLVEVLAQQGQYLPFDPAFIKAGATLGGTVAAGINGSGRFRYGGIRDFILAVQWITGKGEVLRGGAKVVKNAAGFDFPKFFTGSLGRFGVLTELTFKVFPHPTATLTIRAPVELQRLPGRLASAASGRWEFDALDYDVKSGQLYARLSGPASSNRELATDLLGQWDGGAVIGETDAHLCWSQGTEFAWADKFTFLIKVPTVLEDLQALEVLPAGCEARITAAGNCTWIAFNEAHREGVLSLIQSAGLRGLAIRGDTLPLFIGSTNSSKVQENIRQVFDPVNRFPGN